MRPERAITRKMIAPCGMNCGICMAYLREKNHCPGCMYPDDDKQVSCRRCTIKNCEKLKGSRKKFCFVCDKIPCRRMKQLDKRYRTKYNMSMLENLQYINEHGIDKFVKKERIRWKCEACGAVINVHRKVCSECGK